MNPALRKHAAIARWLCGLLLGVPLGLHGQDDYCGITPGSAERIAAEIMRQAGHAYDSASSAYYIAVLAPRLAPYYVVYFFQAGMVVGVVEVDICGRQDTPHPGVQYVADSDLPVELLLLEPDGAFRRLEQETGAQPVFATRVFPYGLTVGPTDWSTTDFWWFILDRQGRWHYMTREGKIVRPQGGAQEPPAGERRLPQEP